MADTQFPRRPSCSECFSLQESRRAPGEPKGNLGMDGRCLACLKHLPLHPNEKWQKAKFTYIVSCGKYSIRKIVEWEVRGWANCYEGHLLFTNGCHTTWGWEGKRPGSGAHSYCKHFQMCSLWAGPPVHSQSHAPSRIHLLSQEGKWLSKIRILNPDWCTVGRAAKRDLNPKEVYVIL